MKVNTAYAATGTGVVAGGVAVSPAVAGLVGVYSPPGWIVAGVPGAIWGFLLWQPQIQ